jgi:hypothetical protein
MLRGGRLRPGSPQHGAVLAIVNAKPPPAVGFAER